jgi:hypothetical protein
VWLKGNRVLRRAGPQAPDPRVRDCHWQRCLERCSSKPIEDGGIATCWARSNTGHAAALPSPAMNCRRRPSRFHGAYRGAGCKGTGLPAGCCAFAGAVVAPTRPIKVPAFSPVTSRKLGSWHVNRPSKPLAGISVRQPESTRHNQ